MRTRNRKMIKVSTATSICFGRALTLLVVLAGLILLVPGDALAAKKKKKDERAEDSGGDRLFEYRVAESTSGRSHPLPSIFCGTEALSS